MNDPQETTANAPSEQKLCKMGCGFFGSNACGDCCSKCFNELNKKEGVAAAAAAPSQPSPTPPAPIAAPATPMTITSPSSVSAPAPSVADAEINAAAAASPVKKKKKKKKLSYKNMISGMMEGSGERDAEKEKESISKVTGGGAFVKIDKI
jgi:hypothetical protein|eukprot:102296_1